MKACISVAGQVDQITPEWLEVVAMSARNRRLEGYVARGTRQDKEFKIIICGQKDQTDLFLDELHVQGISYGLHDVKVSPFVQDKDYRGAFRVMW